MADTPKPHSNPGCIKGSVLSSRLGFVRDRKGDVGVKATLARLAEADQRSLSGTIMPFAWYPFDLYTRLDAAIALEMGIGDQIFVILGQRSAADNLGADHKSYVRDRDPQGLLRHAATIYRLYYDTGRRTYDRMGDRVAVLRTHEALTFSRADCLTVVGWHEKAIELCGGRKIRVTETQCRANGKPICEYHCEWD